MLPFQCSIHLSDTFQMCCDSICSRIVQHTDTEIESKRNSENYYKVIFDIFGREIVLSVLGYELAGVVFVLVYNQDFKIQNSIF